MPCGTATTLTDSSVTPIFKCPSTLPRFAPGFPHWPALAHLSLRPLVSPLPPLPFHHLLSSLFPLPPTSTPGALNSVFPNTEQFAYFLTLLYLPIPCLESRFSHPKHPIKEYFPEPSQSSFWEEPWFQRFLEQLRPPCHL